MSENDYISALDADLIEKFKRAIELGKWADGKQLTQEQRETCMRAIIVFEANLPEAERTGYVPPKETACAPKDEEAPIKWK